MNPTDRRRAIADISMAVIVTAVLIAVISIAFDHYYEFNDDVLMKDILSGRYTGTPNGLNIQMLSPIGGVLASLYRILPHHAWYGIFLCGLHYLCILLMAYRSVHVSSVFSARISVAVIVFLFSMGVLLPHIVMAQYTVTVAILASAAALFFYTIPAGVTGRRFVLYAILPALLVILAFQVRSEMMLLCLPYIAATGIARWSREKQPFDRNTAGGYAGTVAIIALGMIVSFAMNAASYSSGEWKVFLMEFDNRTELYDYQYIPSYEENTAFYESIHLTEADVALLENYDYALDERIDGAVLGQVAAYAKKLRGESVTSVVSGGIREYLYRMTHFSDGVYALLVLFLYVMLIIAVISDKDRTVKRKVMILIVRVGGLLCARSISWIYIICGRRSPDRIVHSLYILESIILFAMLITEFTGHLREGRYLQMITIIVLVAGGMIMVPLSISRLNEHIAGQEQINRYDRAIEEYCAAHPDNFYFEDVYSTIIDGETFNERMFDGEDDRIRNRDLLGGWIANSPLYREKLAQFGVKDVADSILNNDNVYILCSDEYDMSWLSDYYADREITVQTERVDTIAGAYGVYAVGPAH
ncbi:MAG: hypothetical protein K5673_03050 [Lachnospiraceae bacterium]|nr:hypothetical protein [Lachnospiraceae bacterium]